MKARVAFAVVAASILCSTCCPSAPLRTGPLPQPTVIVPTLPFIAQPTRVPPLPPLLPREYCGDGRCDALENAQTCPQDCAAATPVVPPQRPPLPISPPVGTPGGPYTDQVYRATSADGLTWSLDEQMLFDHASVPDVIHLRDGTFWLYFVDFSEAPGPGTEQISVARSTDGRTWSQKQPVTIQGKTAKGAAVDPDVVELADGRLRLYHFGSDVTGGDPGQADATAPTGSPRPSMGAGTSTAGPHKIYSAISRDGVNFEEEPGVRYQAEGITDPDVAQLPDGTWRMYLSRGRQVLSAHSSDGLNFTADEGTRSDIGGVPGSAVLPDGRVRLYVCGNGIVSLTSGDGLHFIPEDGVRIAASSGFLVCDPSVVRLSDGGWLMVYKRRRIEGAEGP